MKRSFAITVLCTAVALVISAQAKDVPKDVQEALISLDKQWGEAGGDAAKRTKSSATTYWRSVPTAKRKTRRR
jgi:hypothetical protein